MPRLQPNKYGFVFGNLYKYGGFQFQYQGEFEGGLQFSRLPSAEVFNLSPETARERFM